MYKRQVKQMAGKTPMVVMTMDGEKLMGVIEWYDEGAIKPVSYTHLTLPTSDLV